MFLCLDHVSKLCYTHQLLIDLYISHDLSICMCVYVRVCMFIVVAVIRFENQNNERKKNDLVFLVIGLCFLCLNIINAFFFTFYRGEIFFPLLTIFKTHFFSSAKGLASVKILETFHFCIDHQFIWRCPLSAGAKS